MHPLALVALGGAIGAALRYGVARALGRLGGGFPVATTVVNVVGCFAIGWVLAWLERAGRAGEVSPARAEELRLLLTVGLLGGLTTFSAFGQETVALLRHGRFGAAGASVALQLGLGFAAVAVGARLGG